MLKRFSAFLEILLKHICSFTQEISSKQQGRTKEMKTEYSEKRREL